jgi:carbonic anhydrase
LIVNLGALAVSATIGTPSGAHESAWERRQALAVHGWIYGLDDGRLRNLNCSRAGAE